jgi:hypothetical protein
VVSIPVKDSDGTLQSVTVNMMPEVTQDIKTQPPQITSEKEKIPAMTVHLIYYNQGDEDYLQDAMLEFFSTNPKIIYTTTWVVGITTYFMFIYR